MSKINTKIADLLLQMHGIDVSGFDETFLYKSVQKKITETHCKSEDEYYTLLEQNEKEAHHFLNSLRISYSEFFRNPLTYSVLERIVLPSIVSGKQNAKRKEIRIWSAACASGQEPYSLAMLLEEMKNTDCNICNYRIFATDQSELMLSEARTGSYPADALNNISMKRVKQWFIKNGESYTVKPELKKNIEFSVFDLFNETLACPPSSIFGDFDLVIFANLLFYYKNEYREKILKKTYSSLARGGFLITGETEREILIRKNYREVFPQSAIFHI